MGISPALSEHTHKVLQALVLFATAVNGGTKPYVLSMNTQATADLLSAVTATAAGTGRTQQQPVRRGTTGELQKAPKGKNEAGRSGFGSLF